MARNQTIYEFVETYGPAIFIALLGLTLGFYSAWIAYGDGVKREECERMGGVVDEYNSAHWECVDRD